ncbi:MAG: hypothetical protein AB7F65_04935 [Dehalococcoidia bacterium]
MMTMNRVGRAFLSIALAASTVLALAILAGCVSPGDEEETATPTPTPTPTATPAETPEPTPTVSPEVQALLDLIPADAQPTILDIFVQDSLQMVGYPQPLQIFKSPHPALTVAAAAAVTDGTTVEMTFTVGGPASDLAWIEYWIGVDLPEDVIEPTPLTVFGEAGLGRTEPEVEAYVRAANGGVFYYEAAVEYLDELTRRVTVRIPPGWATPDSMTILVNGYLDPDGYLLNVGVPAGIEIEPVDVVETRGLPEPGPIEHLIEAAAPGTRGQGALIEWSHPAVRATVTAPDDWSGYSFAHGLVLFGREPDAAGRPQLVTLGLIEFDAGGPTPGEIIDEFVSLSGGGVEELTRLADDAAPFDAGLLAATVRDFQIEPGASAALPDGWTSSRGALTAMAVAALPDGRTVLAYIETSGETFDVFQSVVGLLDLAQIER